MNTAVDTAQDAVAGVAGTAADVTGAVGERLPGPLGGLTKAAAGAVEAVADAVADSDKDKDADADEDNEESK